MSRKEKIWIGGSIGVTALVWGFVMFSESPPNWLRHGNALSWKQARIAAGYVGSELKEIDKAHSALVISYEVENDGGSDYRLAEGPGVHVLTRLKSDGSLSLEQTVRLSYPVFLPPGQRARLAIEMTEPFAWPDETDPAYQEKLREFVKRRLGNVAEFVVFDEANHSQLQLPSAWGELPEARAASL